MAGTIAGEIASTAPVTGGLMAGGKVIQGADKLRKGNLFRKTIGSSPAVLGADAALTMGVAGGPDDRLKNAALGGTIGLATGGLIKGGASLLNKPWIRKSKEALALEARTGKNIPLSQSGTGPGKLFYESIVANFPGSAKAIRGQYDDALDDFRKFVSEEAMPPGGLQELPANWATMSAQNMIKTLRETGLVKFYVCSASLNIMNINENDLFVVDGILGLSTFLNKAEKASIVLYI